MWCGVDNCLGEAPNEYFHMYDYDHTAEYRVTDASELHQMFSKLRPGLAEPMRRPVSHLAERDGEVMLLSELRARWAYLRSRVQNLGHEVIIPCSTGYMKVKHQDDCGGDVSKAMVQIEDMLRVYAAPSVVDTEEYQERLAEVIPPELIARSISEFYSAACLNRRWVLTEIDWLHYGLLERSAPSQYDFDTISSKLKEWTRVDPSAQPCLLETFLRSCEGYPEPLLTLAQATKIISQWIEQGTFYTFMQGTVDSSVEIMGQQIIVPIQRLQTLVESEEFLSNERFNYYEFLLHVLGCRKTKVQINMYDITKGHAQWISPALIGEEVSGIWHTSVVAFGQEIWFGGSVFVNEPGDSVWGKPARVHEMPGWTLRNFQELTRFIQRDLAFRFSQQRYDILTNNCNHFSDGVCMFLLNSHLPQNIMQQPDLILGSHGTPLQVLRPLLNTFLGGFDAKNDNELPVDPKFAAHTERQRSKLMPFSYVHWEYRKGWRRIAQLLSIDGSRDAGMIQWLDARTGISRIEKEIPLSSLMPTKPLVANQDVAAMELLRSADKICKSDFLARNASKSLPCDTQQIPRPKKRVQPSQSWPPCVVDPDLDLDCI